MLVCVCTWTQWPCRPKEVSDPLKQANKQLWIVWCSYWELNTSPLQEQALINSLTAEPFSRTWGNIFNISLMLCSHDLILCFSDAEWSWASFLGFHFFFHLLSSCNAFQGFCSFLLGYIFYYINTDNTFYNMNKKLYTKKCFSKPGTFQLLKRIFQHASLGPLAMGK